MKNYWVIDGDYWNCNKYTYEEAKALSETLVNCKHCLNCEYCVNCTDCENCNNC